MQIPAAQMNAAVAASTPLQARTAQSTTTGPGTAPTTMAGVEKVEHGEQTQDRDANEHYVGGGHREGQHKEPRKDDHPVETSLLQLEVNADEGPSQLDLRG